MIEFMSVINNDNRVYTRVSDISQSLIGSIQADEDFHTVQWKRNFGFFFIYLLIYSPLPGQIMEVLRSNISIQISPLLGKKTGNKHSENKDKGWETREKVQTMSNQGLLFLRSPAAWNARDFCHQQWAKSYHVSSQCPCLGAGGRVRVGGSGQLSPLQSSGSVTIKWKG